MTAIGKISTVVLAVAAVLFMVASLAVYFTGPNWLAKAGKVDGYAFSRSAGENPQWTATDVATGEDVKTAPYLADVIPAAVDAKVRKVEADIAALDERKAQLQNAVQVYEATSAADAAALQARIDRLRTRIAGLRDQTVQVAGQLSTVNDQIGQVETQIAARRGDVFRLRTVLDQAELDAVRAERLRGQLADLLVQLDAELEAANQRRDQLREALGQSAPNTQPVAAGGRQGDAL